jgi:hypothetical protein
MKYPAIRALLFVWSVAALCAVLAGCGSSGFNDAAMKALAERNPIQLDSEQVSLTEGQVNCGVANDLWYEAPGDGGRAIYRLTEKGRDLKFSDNVYARDPDFPFPYTQLRGKFNLSLTRVVSVQDGSEQGTKLVQAALGVKIPHSCFADPLLIMGIAKGRFTTNLAPTLLYENDNDVWSAVKLVH